MPRRFRTEIADRLLALMGRFEMAVFLELDGVLNVPQVVRAVQLAVPLLRCRFVEHWWQPRFEERPEVTAVQIVATETDGDPEQRFLEFLAKPMDHSLQVVVHNGVRGALAIKLDHRLADYRSLIQLLYLLAEVYSQLEKDPEYVLPTYPRFERGFRQFAETLSLSQRLRLLRSWRRRNDLLSLSGRWRLPSVSNSNAESVSVLHTFNASEVEALEAYGCSLRGTLFHVLLSAFFLAMTELLADSDSFLSVITSMDLRRNLRPNQPLPFGNLTGTEFLFLKLGPSTSLARIVRDVRKQLFERRDAGLGLTGLASLDLIPLLRFLPSLVPFALLRRLTRRRIARMFELRERPWIQALPGGEFNPGRLRFGNLPPQRVFGCACPLDGPSQYHFGMTGFAGTVTAFWGSGPRAEMENLRARVLNILEPVLSASASC
jgi:NRPS condensation-like uncharacterized protein